MAAPNKAKLRQLLLNFYQVNDPVVLNQGLDISGLVEFATEKGVNVLNGLLMRKYGKTIDINQEIGSAKENIANTRMSFAPSAKIVEKEHEYRMKLHNFFSKYDPEMVDQSRARTFEKFVKFAMLNGLDKLSEKFRQKYGAGVDDSGYTPTAADQKGTVAEEPMAMLEAGLNPFNLDINRLRKDMEDFYVFHEDDEQVEVLDETVDWACEVGIEKFNSQLQQLYGMGLNDFLEQAGKRIHVNQVEVPTPPPPAPAQTYDEDDEVSEYEVVEERVEVPNVERPFEEMKDGEIVQELHAFYSEYDEDNIANLDKVLELSRKIGREALNNHLMKIYEDKLTPVPAMITKVVQKRVKIPKQPKRDVPALPPGLPSREVPALPPVMPERRDIPAFTPPTNQVTGFDDSQPPPINTRFNPNQKDDAFRAAITQAVAQPNMKPVPQQQQKPVQPDEDEDLPEFLRKWKGMKKRIDIGKAKVRDGQGGVFEINILIDVCKDYKLDPMSGICAKCGFAKNDHWNLPKAKRR